jgi:hypothetical protein
VCGIAANFFAGKSRSNVRSWPILLKKSVSNLRLAGPAIQRPSIASR